MKERPIEELKETNNIGILLDESTDVSNKSILLLYVRYFSKKQKTTNECPFKNNWNSNMEMPNIYIKKLRNIFRNKYFQ